ncbi:MAG: M13-type metalloendopeptidase [Woeseiaceae bacterium]|nr:M13-type metalloendopeptidase [Woeseiaceae bacterium]
MNRIWLAALAAVVVAGCGGQGDTPAPAAAVPAPLVSGVDLDGMDRSVRPQDDFYHYANGTWLATTEIPADQVGWGSYMTLRDRGLEQLRTIIEEIGTDTGTGEAAAKIAAFYAAYLDEAGIEAAGIGPVEDLLTEIEALDSHAAVARFFGSGNVIGLDAPFNLYINQDDKDPDTYVINVVQSGLGLPDRDYYFDRSERGLHILEEYRGFVTRLFGLTGHDDPDGAADCVLALETRLAEPQWDKVDNRDADKTYNKTDWDELGALLGGFDRDGYFDGLGAGEQDYVIVHQPSYLEAFGGIFTATDVATWREYARLNLVLAYANYLPEEFVDANFEFYSKTLFGREAQLPRWKRAVNSINGNMGELLGQLYVAKHFPPEAKERMVGLVDNLMRAYADSIENLEWMSDETKAQALVKLRKFTPKIGYPDKWKDYSGLEVSDDSLVQNIRNARAFNHFREMDKLGAPVDRTEWFLAPQVVNAYYNPGMNEIVFPAAYLQPPNFQLDADDAYNYGAIGVTIGHEIGHGFDDQGSKYDGDGNLKSWWTEADRVRFEERTRGLVEQFNGFEALPGLFVNGELTLGENIGDLGGMAIALKAYRLSLGGEEPPIIDGFTGEERFFLGFAQSSRIKWREQLIEFLVKNDPHAPDVFRVNGVVPNVDAFYETYDVREGDGHYLPPEQRVRIWN